MSQTPKELTVALPTCNGSPHLAETLRSILDQAEMPYDLLVCDDCSDDDSLALVSREAGDRARVVVNPERLGLAGNWNRCVELAKTPLIAIVHQDDLILPGHFTAHLAAFARHPNLAMTFGAFAVIDDFGKPIPPTVIERPDLGPADRLFPAGALVTELASRNPVRCSTVVLRTESLRAVGRFDPGYRYALDWECWLRLSRAFPVCWVAQPTVSVRWHPGSETHRFKRGSADLDEVARLLDHLHNTDAALLPDPASSRRSANRALAAAYLNRALDALHAGQPDLSRHCLRRSLALHPSTRLRILRDPRLAVQMAALQLAPRWAAFHFSRKSTDRM